MKLFSNKVESRHGEYPVFYCPRLVLGGSSLFPLSLIQQMELSIARESVASVIKPLMREAPRIAVVSQQNILSLYQEAFEEYVASVCKTGGIAAGKPEIAYYPIPEGEQRKTLETASSLYDRLLADRITRDSLLVALGGGLTGDMTGFVAATILRGINWVNVPTTLLAQVDASIGGKTGVNHLSGRNLIGAFYPPKAVICDSYFLKTLPPP